MLPQPPRSMINNNSEQFHADMNFPDYTEWLHTSFLHQPTRTIEVEQQPCHVEMHDLLLKPIHQNHDAEISWGYWTRLLPNVRGCILLYDITDRQSFDSVTGADYQTFLSFRNKVPSADDGENVRNVDSTDGEVYLGAFKRFGGILVGNKLDLLTKENAAKREVPKSLAEEWASMHGMKHFETDTFSQETLDPIVKDLIMLIKKAELRDKEDLDLMRRHGVAPSQDTAGAAQSSHGKNHVSSLSRSFSKMLRQTLPRTSSKKKKPVDSQEVEEDTPPWSMFLSSTASPSEQTSPT